MGQVKDKEQRFFHLEISIDSTEQISLLITLTREIKRVIANGQGQIETLWDDVSLYYSQKAYPYIHKIENLMRKLITYFMLTKVGKDWVNTASPGTIKKQIDSRKKQNIDVLFQVDFIHLGDLLFKSYTSKSIEELFDLAETQEDPEEFNIETVLEFKPRSNWDRYFSEIVDCEAEYLNKRWKQLYELRCDIAHNKPFGPSKLQDNAFRK